MIPSFDPKSGNLPVGIHRASWSEFRARFGFNERRLAMLEGLRVAVRVLLDAGCQRVLIDGSFVTAKVHPGDYDGTWDTTGVEFDRLDPVLIDFGNRRRAMKAKYLGELFPARANAASGLTFEQFFQQDRQGRPKGIIELDLGTVP